MKKTIWAAVVAALFVFFWTYLSFGVEGDPVIAESSNRVSVQGLDLGGANYLEIPNATSPIVDAEGEIAWESDDDVLRIYDGAVDVVIAEKTKTRSFVIPSILNTHDFPFWKTKRAIVITSIWAICLNGTNVIGQLQEYAGDGTTPTDVDSAGDWTITTTQLNDTDFGTYDGHDAGDWVGWKTTSVSGTVDFLSLTFEYYEK